MRRYVRQADRFSCGPVALLNALKWLGLPYTRKSLPALVDACGCVAPHGTPIDLFHPVVRLYLSRHFVRCLHNLCKPELDRFLNQPGHAAILNYGFRSGSRVAGHYVFLPGMWNGLYMIVNAGADYDTLDYFDARRFRRRCLQRFPHKKPIAWLIASSRWPRPACT